MTNAREWRQFRLLARDSVRRLLSSAVLSREADPWQFAIWMTALVQTPPTLYAMGQMFKYAVLRRADALTMERVVLSDRMFFVFYAMTAAALLASVTWEALFPDRVDQEIVGALPVRPRTLAAARLAAAIVAGLAFALAVNLPSALFFALIAATHPLLGHVYTVFAGHLLGTIAGSLAVFLGLLVIRGLAAVVLNAAAANTLAAVLQLASVSALIEVFLYLPSVLPRLLQAMLDGGAPPQVLLRAPIWFTALYTVVAGTARPSMWASAASGLAVMAVALPLVVAVYLLPAGWMARRALETSSTQSARWLSGLTRIACRLLAYPPRVRAITTFTVASLTRSRRHVLVVITQLGIGLAFAAINVIGATMRRQVELHAPARYLLALPLVMMFFGALGLRSAFAIATEFDANWPFRVAAAGVSDAAAGARRAIIGLLVLPIAAIAFLASLGLGWDAAVAARIAAFDVLSGVLLVECVAYAWHFVPFTHEHVISGQSLKWRGLIAIVPMYLFAFVGARAQMAALQSPRAAAWYVAVMGGLAAAVGHFSRRESARHGLAFDDEGDESLAVLNLSNAI